MATLDDKLLGEKREYYCDSSEDEDKQDEDEECDRDSRTQEASNNAGASVNAGSSRSQQQRWDGVSKNTGPKGVLEDWYLFQKHEEQMRANKERELVAMVEQTSLTCLPNVNGTNNAQVIVENDDLESDDVLQDFIKRRMEAMLQAQTERNQFFGVTEVSSADEYLKLVDDKNSKVVIVLHIYENNISHCAKMNDSLDSISREHRHIKFCKMRGSVAGVSNLFKVEGIPALLVYRGGELIGNFIRLKEEFGNDFYAGDVENYLIENGILSTSKT